MAKMNRERASNSAEESPSLNHMEEEQRTILLHHPQASSSRLPALDQHTDQSSSATTKATVFADGSRFNPSDLGLVRVHLKDMVEKGKRSSFITITTLDVYDGEPWLLDHVHNDLFKRDEWYYFVPRIKRGEKACKRTVPARGESEGGTWKSNNGKEEIKDKHNKVEGYKQNLVYNKTVNGKAKPTDWLMTEYCLREDNRDDLVLCHIRGKLEKKVNDITKRSKNRRALTYEEKGKAKMVCEDEQPSRISSIVRPNKCPIRFKAQRSSPQVALKSRGQFVAQVPQVDDNILRNQVQDEEADLAGFANEIEKEMPQGDHSDAIQQQDIPSLPPLEINGNNITMSSNQAGLTGFANQTDTRMLGGEHGDATRQQQQDTPFPSLLLLQGQDSELEKVMMTTQNNDNNIMTRPCEDLMNYYFPGAGEFMLDVEELINMEDDSNQQQPSFQYQDLGGSVG